MSAEPLFTVRASVVNFVEVLVGDIWSVSCVAPDTVVFVSVVFWVGVVPSGWPASDACRCSNSRQRSSTRLSGWTRSPVAGS